MAANWQTSWRRNAAGASTIASFKKGTRMGPRTKDPATSARIAALPKNPNSRECRRSCTSHDNVHLSDPACEVESPHRGQQRQGCRLVEGPTLIAKRNVRTVTPLGVPRVSGSLLRYTGRDRSLAASRRRLITACTKLCGTPKERQGRKREGGGKGRGRGEPARAQVHRPGQSTPAPALAHGLPTPSIRIPHPASRIPHLAPPAPPPTHRHTSLSP
jgi:hypothetical protein